MHPEMGVHEQGTIVIANSEIEAIVGVVPRGTEGTIIRWKSHGMVRVEYENGITINTFPHNLDVVSEPPVKDWLVRVHVYAETFVRARSEAEAIRNHPDVDLPSYIIVDLTVEAEADKEK